MGYAKYATAVAKRLKGFVPVYKDRDVRMLDLMDWIRLTMEFDLNISFKKQGIRIDACPFLRKDEEGITHFCFGVQAKRDSRHIRHGNFGYHVCATLGERLPILSDNGLTSKPFDQVTATDLLDTMNGFKGEALQVRIAKEEEGVRDNITEMNKPDREVIRGQFYEGTQPRVVRLVSIENLSCDLPHFEFDMTASGFFCVYRFIDDLSLQLGTFARINRLILNQFFDIGVADCLRKHELHSREIIRVLRKSEKRYAPIIQKCVEGRSTKGNYLCPW